MAETPQPKIDINGGCPDCGSRIADLPKPLPDLGDDFDWLVRDYDGFRRFMMEELAARFPDRSRWTPADMEMVIVEVLATALDQLSDSLDRITAESYLQTARRPESVRRHLQLIGYDALKFSQIELSDEEKNDLNSEDQEKLKIERLETLWAQQPHLMEWAKQEGPRSIHTQRRMVTEEDHAIRLEEHPLVLRAHAWSSWEGSWNAVQVAVIGWENKLLDKDIHNISTIDESLKEEVVVFHDARGLGEIVWAEPLTLRTLLRQYIDAYRMAGQEVLLRDINPVGITMALSITVAPNFYQSEIRLGVEQVLGRGPDGFFRPGRLRFGEDLHASDIIEALMSMDGVENVCLNRFKRLGRQFADQSSSGLIRLEGLDIAVCDNDPRVPERGYFTLKLHGGRKG